MEKIYYLQNHELWYVCECGEEFDVRLWAACPMCKVKVKL